MKILVMCPGSFVHKLGGGHASNSSTGHSFTALNSPERGEGRWAQNYARMLAMAGHNVFAASGGIGQYEKQSEGCTLIDQGHCHKYGDFDLYIDAAWWDKKEPPVKAKRNIALKWSIENYLRDTEFADDFYLAYPYSVHHWNFSRPSFINRDKTFALPTMFGLDFKSPNWDKTSVFLPGKVDENRHYQTYVPAIGEFLNKHPIEGRSKIQFERIFAGLIDFNRSDSNWHDLTPYDKIIESMSRSRISLPVLNPGCIIEAAFQGVPSIFWAHGGFYNPLAEMLNISIEHNAPPERFTEVAELLMNNKKKYFEVVYASQEYFSAHTYANSLKYFNLMIESIF